MLKVKVYGQINGLFKCNYCERTYDKKASMYVHMSLKHHELREKQKEEEMKIKKMRKKEKEEEEKKKKKKKKKKKIGILSKEFNTVLMEKLNFDVV